MVPRRSRRERPGLGPPEDLLDETTECAEELKVAGLCEAEVHNAAWAETGFAERYRDHLADSDAAAAELGRLADLVCEGTDVTLVGFEDEDRRCHRDLLVEALRKRAGGP